MCKLSMGVLRDGMVETRFENSQRTVVTSIPDGARLRTVGRNIGELGHY